MPTPIILDGIDMQILKLMVADARVAYAEIARQCGLSGAAVQQRVKTMHDNNVIKSMRAIVDTEYLNLGVCAFVNIKISQPNMMDSVIDSLKTMREVVECHGIMGQFTLMAKVYCRNNTHFMELVVDNILKIPGIADTASYISLKQFIDHPVPVFDDEQQTGSACCG